MRTSTIISISLPPTMVKDCARFAKKRHMTRSEFFRSALRTFLDEAMLEEAIRVADDEQSQGKLKRLPRGGLARLMKST